MCSSDLYRKQIEERLGVPLPPPDEELPEDMEVQLARLIADAGKQVAQSHQQQAAQQQAQQQAADPLFQLEQSKVKVQEMEVTRKAQKDQTDAQLAAEKLKLEAMRTMATVENEKVRVSSQDKQSADRLRLDALKVLATPKSKPPASGKKE